jgi:hypothetical protein
MIASAIVSPTTTPAARAAADGCLDGVGGVAAASFSSSDEFMVEA